MSILQVIMAVPEHQREAAQRLVDHCLKLDGTEIKVVHITPDQDAAFKCQFPTNRFNCLQAFGFHKGALAARSKPFLWLEADSIPLKPGWLKAISKEYDNCRKPFLLPDMSGLSQFDYASGIGVYPPIASQLIPMQFELGGWDKWLQDHKPELIARTKLIQHSYGIYEKDIEKCVEHRFPRDAVMIRPEALIFHRSKYQDLINCFHER